jgi:predicted MFS family arabinose efflux permease
MLRNFRQPLRPDRGAGRPPAGIGTRVIHDGLPVFRRHLVAWARRAHRRYAFTDGSRIRELFHLLRGRHAPACGSVFASTVGWPLSSLGLETIGWRETCYAWAVAHIVIGLPLNLLLPRTERIVQSKGPTVKPHIAIDRTMVLLSFAFAAAWTVTSAMAAHLPRIVEAFGATPAQAVFAGMMIGPAQVAARVMEASLLGRFHPLVSTRLACITHPIGACVIGIFGGGAAAAFALLHGAGNGILTIARGTLPLAIFGPENYAYRLGLIGAPSRIAQAVAPLAFGLLLEPMGRGVVVVSAGLSLSALIALLLLRAPSASRDVAAVAESP